MVDTYTGKGATLPGKSGRSRYLDSAVQSAAAHVERLQYQVQGMSRVAERTVRGRKGAVRLQRREATLGLPNLRARRACGHHWGTNAAKRLKRKIDGISPGDEKANTLQWMNRNNVEPIDADNLECLLQQASSVGRRCRRWKCRKQRAAIVSRRQR